MRDSLLGGYWAGWKNTFVYDGCATRQDFWSFILGNALVVFLIAGGFYFLLVEVIADKTSAGGMMLVWAYFVYLPLRMIVPLILLLPIIALGIRRMHDIGKSGWWFGGLLLIQLIGLPVFITGIYYLFRDFFSDADFQLISNGINLTFTTIISIALLWLCCQPTKIKDLTSSSEAVN
ncbi:DUF805 domain-containing protein [Lelliottia wanjuensis]|uniref:DUF805 domain-containing protein n=1 Tax=Lelliottia wanjuensis TaxID=3050585 RepID=UPI00254F1947|nr:DUF805 domain-containing protein [Lelliottia sp. V104_15]MDK9605705.1 DUF805 domain-containing protein [Lelliottia sp. V104_15]